jgi:hypothetical protein
MSAETGHYKLSAVPISTQGADVDQPVFTITGQLTTTEVADQAAALGEVLYYPRPASPRTAPPAIPELLVSLCAKKRYRNAILNDLDEDFQRNLSKGMTIARAGRIYWGGALYSIIPQLWAAAKRIGVFALIARLLH